MIKKIGSFLGAVIVTLILMPLTFVVAQQNPAQFPALSELQLLISHPEGTTPWSTHVNKTYKYKIGYPAGWRAKKFFPHLTGFQPPSMSGNNVQWAVIVIDDIAPETITKEIAKMGTEYKTGRSEVIENITINGEQAIRVTVRSLEKPEWVHRQIFVRSYGKIYEITNGGIENNDFELFYSSFRLMKE